MKHYLKTPIQRHWAGWAVAATMAIGLAACGGGGGDDQVTTTVAPAVTPPAGVPASAVVDVGAFVGYLNTLAVNDSQEPLLTDAVTPPTNDTGEPTAI